MKNLYKYELNESIAAKATMNCLKNRNIPKMQEQEEHPEDYDRLQSQLADAWDEGMEDDEDDYVPYNNTFDETHNDIVDSLLTAVDWYFRREADVEGFNHFQYTEYQIGKAVEQILDKYGDFPSSNNSNKCHAWVRKHAEELMKILETGSLENNYEGHPEFDFSEQEEDSINKGGMHNLVQHGHIMNTHSMHDTYDSEWFSDREEQEAYYDSFRLIAELVADQLDRENDKEVENNMDTLFDIVKEMWQKHNDDLWVYDNEVIESDCEQFFDLYYEEIKEEYLKREHNNLMDATHGDLFGQEKRKIKRNSRSRIVNALVKQLQRYGITMTDKTDIQKAAKKVNEILDETGDYPDLKSFGQMVRWCTKYHREVANAIYR